MVSVIVPTYRRPQSLLRCLYTLQAQTLADFEILVVDNAADAVVRRTVAEFNEGAKVPALYMPEPQLGVHTARHTGARSAKGEILVFTDDDTTFAPKWLESYVEAFANHANMVAAGGPVLPVWESPPPRWLLEFIGDATTFGVLSLMEPYQGFSLDSKNFFFSLNMAIRRDVLFEMGGFNPESFGDTWLGDGETGLNRKITRVGLPIGYVPNALVYHHVPSSRMTPAYFRKRQANQGACMAYSRYHESIPRPVCLIARMVKLALRNSPEWARAALLWNRTSRVALDAQMRAASSFSEIGYILKLMRSSDFRALVTRRDWINSEQPLIK